MLASLEVKGAAIDASPSLTWSGVGLGLVLGLGSGLGLGLGFRFGLGLGLGLGLELYLYEAAEDSRGRRGPVLRA